MSEPQHPQAEGAATNAGRPGHGAAPHAQYAHHGASESLAAVGARLAQLREAKGWSVDDVSARLKVSPAKMRALEAGDISRLPGTTFALGVVRSYAKMLGTDPAPFAQALRREKGEPEPDLSMPASTGTDLPRGRVSVSLGSSTQKHRSWWWGVAAVAVGLAALVMWHTGGGDSSAWFARLKASANGVAANPGGASGTTAQGQTVASDSAGAQQGVVGALAPVAASAAAQASGATLAAASESGAPAASAAASGSSVQVAAQKPAQPETAPTPQASAPAVQTQSAPASGAQAAMAKAQPASTPAAAAPNASSSSAQPAARATSGAGAADVTAAQAGASTVAVKVTQDSWFSVHDKSGKEVFSGLIRAGETKEVSGAAPFKVVAGNRAGLESMTLDGQPVDTAKYGAGKGNVARFTLP
ncbi:MAG TPA: RodZ domain-containing protein [Trinickia sp.]|nr:RodZ domain-containing protein [Trinickia sp.]